MPIEAWSGCLLLTSRGKMVKLALVSGSWPPDACGVGDYTSNVADHLQIYGVNVIKIGGKRNGRNGIVLPIIRNSFDIIHIQYPSMGYGRSLSPAMIPILKKGSKICVTLHEFANFHPLRRPWFFTFAHMVDARIFTNEEEKRAFHEIMRPRSGSDDIIPIASNIRRGSGSKVPGSICNFGLITPNKGIERFIELASLAKASKQLSFALIGAKTDMYAAYADEIIDKCRSIGLPVHVNLPDGALAEMLSTFEFAYLPFPDGASSKRGSLLALLNNGVTVLTTHTDLTHDDIRTSTIAAPSPEDARDILERLIGDDHRSIGMVQSGKVTQSPGWGEIAVRHLEIYKSIL